MRRTRFDAALCPIARATDLIGDWWTPIILRDAMFGRTRFEDFQTGLGVPRAILTRRLSRLVSEGLMERVRYAERPPRYEYLLTAKGRAFIDVLAAMWRWGEDWLWPEGKAPLVMLADRETRQEIRPVIVDEHTGQRIDLERLRVVRRSKPTPA
jgi:DNA-binding HxlR family transcriptional regulator